MVLKIKLMYLQNKDTPANYLLPSLSFIENYILQEFVESNQSASVYVN